MLKKTLSKIRNSTQLVEIGRREFLYLFLMGGAALFGFIRTMVYGAYLSPTNMGYYSIAITIASYGTFLQLGLMSGLSRELPVCFGQGKKEYSSELVGEATTAIAFLQLIGFIVYYIVIANITFKDSFTQNAFFLGGLLALSSPFGQMVMLRLRAEQRVLSFSLLQLINAACILVLGILAINVVGYAGAIITIVLVNVLGFAIVSKAFLSPVNYLYFKSKEIFYLIRIGFPMVVAGVLLTVQFSMDRFFILKYRSVEELGIYQVGILPLTMGVILSSIIVQYVGPKLLFRYGQGQSPGFVFHRSIMLSAVTVGVLLLFWPLFLFIMNFVVNQWLPDYKASLPLMSTFYLGAVFTAANIGVLFNAVNRQIMNLYISVVAVCMVFIGNVLVTYFNKPIEWYAYVNVLGQIAVFLLTIGISFYMIRNDLECKLSNPVD